MRKTIIPLILFALLAFGCVLNFDQSETTPDAPRPVKPQTPAEEETAEQVVPSELTTAPHSEIQSIPIDATKFAASGNAFAFDIYNQAAANNPEDNLFFSPYSIYTALGMTYAGSKRDTEEQMREALYFSEDMMSQHAAFRDMSRKLNQIGERDKAQLSVANGVFQAKLHENALLPEYQNILKKYYDSEMYSLDFGQAKQTADYINDWVLERTNKRIKDLVNEQHIRSSNNGMLLVNAIFFKANWLKQFDPKNTNVMSFYPIREKEIPVNMMYTRDDFGYTEVADMQVIELPYDEEELSMLVFLPILTDKLPQFDNDMVFEAMKNFRKQDVMLWMPSFTLDLELGEIPEMLTNMGMKDAFIENYADFTGIRDPKAGADLFIKDILHKAFIEVNEEGTEAAAATSVIMATKSAAMPDEKKPIVFRADRPFTYMIVHRPSQTILFMGKLINPPRAEK